MRSGVDSTNAHDLADAEPLGEDLREGEIRPARLRDVDDAAESCSGSGHDVTGVSRGGAIVAVARRNRIAVRIEPRVAERRRQRVDLIGGERVLAAFGGRVHVPKRQPRFVGEVAFEQPMRADDLQREALALGGQLELLPARDDQPLRLHPADERISRRSLRRSAPASDDERRRAGRGTPARRDA